MLMGGRDCGEGQAGETSGIVGIAFCVDFDDEVLIGTYFFFNDAATPEIYTLSLHAALPICTPSFVFPHRISRNLGEIGEHTSELQSRRYIASAVCCLKTKS